MYGDPASSSPPLGTCSELIYAYSDYDAEQDAAWEPPRKHLPQVTKNAKFLNLNNLT